MMSHLKEDLMPRIILCSVRDLLRWCLLNLKHFKLLPPNSIFAVYEMSRPKKHLSKRCLRWLCDLANLWSHFFSSQKMCSAEYDSSSTRLPRICCPASSVRVGVRMILMKKMHAGMPKHRWSLAAYCTQSNADDAWSSLHCCDKALIL